MFDPAAYEARAMRELTAFTRRDTLIAWWEEQSSALSQLGRASPGYHRLEAAYVARGRDISIARNREIFAAVYVR